MLEDYLLHLRKHSSPNSIPTIFAGVELFLRANDKMLNFWKLHKMFPPKIKKSGFRAYTTKEVKEMLTFAKSKRNKALIHILASTGCRIGALSGLVLKDVVDIPQDCKGILLYRDTEEEYWAFLTPEASKALNEYLEERKNNQEHISENSTLFRMDYKVGIEKVKPLGYNATFSIMYRLIVGSKIQRIKKDNRFDVMMDHGFRKRFNGILKMNNEINSNIAEKLMAHKRGLDSSYLKPTREQCFKEFVKAIPELTIDDSERLKIENKRKDEKISEFEEEKKKRNELELDMEKIRNEIEEMKKKRVEENESGAVTRYVAFTKNLFNYIANDSSSGKIFSIIFYLWFEMRATEEEKRKIWERLQQAKENGEKFGISWFGESAGLSWKNFYSKTPIA